MGQPNKNFAEDRCLTAVDVEEVQPIIAGKAIPSDSSERLDVLNPSTGQRLLSMPIGSIADADAAVVSARKSFDKGEWRFMSPTLRTAALERWANLIDDHASRLDRLDALEMGKPIHIRSFNAHAAASFLRFNATAMDKLAGHVLPSDSASTVVQKFVPRGVVAAIVPWNFPTYNVILKIAPALAAGNSVVLKPSEAASQSALLLVRLAHQAGVPASTLNLVPGIGEIVGRALGEHPDVDMIAFTGSTEVGKKMLQYSGHSSMKVVNAECGGKSPHILFDDGCDLEVAADSIAAMMVMNQGQVCSVGSRLIVEESIKGQVLERIAQRLSQVVAGDPQEPSTSYGPLVSKAQKEKVLSFVAQGCAQGARLAYGGGEMLPKSGGFFLKPAVLMDVDPDNAAFREEIFGPVLTVTSFRSIEDAVRLASATKFGLAAYVWSARHSTGWTMARELSTALTIINGSSVFGEGPGHAFSGEPHGLSGIGPEGGLAGLQSYMRRQTIWLNHG